VWFVILIWFFSLRGVFWEEAMERRRWSEVGLVILGVLLHSSYMLSIFDIYFKTPIVHGMNPEPLGIRAPAKRLVLFIADGMRADKFFEMDTTGKPRAPYLHNIMHNKGRWGVSHARPPTESRPGHVAIIAGLYEDPSAVTKGACNKEILGFGRLEGKSSGV
jgi:phosphatidylinositol glycan class N